jgi:hypothetical protein
MAIFVGGKGPEKFQDVRDAAFRNENRQNNVIKSEPRIKDHSLDPKKQYVVVNGKPKEIKKHSQYLIDMLTIEE